MSANPIVDKLEALLARIQQRATEPRPPKRRAPPPIALAPLAPAFELATTALGTSPAPVRPPATRRPDSTPTLDTSSMFAAHDAHEARDAHQEETQDRRLEAATPEQASATALSASGEFEVIEHAELLELEELGPADEYDATGAVVEIDVEESAAHSASDAMIADDERASEPPASGRELVAEPRESARIAVAAIDPSALSHGGRIDDRSPASAGAPESPEISLDDDTFESLPEAPPQRSALAPIAAARGEGLADVVIGHAHTSSLEGAPTDPQIAAEDLPPHEEQVAPPRSEPAPSSPRAVEPPAPLSVPPHSFDVPVTAVAPDRVRPLSPPSRPPPPPPPSMLPSELAPITHAPAYLAPIMSDAGPVATSVLLRSPELAAAPIESVVVAIDADVIRPGVTPADVAAFVGAARTFKPETFGALIDAALEL